MDQNAHGRRPHYHRGRRGQDRRGGERRSPQQPPSQPQQPQPDAASRDPREHVDIEQIMREIRSRISKGSGVDLTNQQIHELAARRLEAILDPRTIKPALLDQLRRGAATADLPPAFNPAPLDVKDESVSASFFQRLFKPLSVILAPILQAFRTQDAINKEAAEREAAANRRQAEWNALQFELLQKLVTETSRVSIEMHSLSLRIESLAAKVDFNEKRVRAIETVPPARPSARHESIAREPREHRDREPREHRDMREPREAREAREPRDHREPSPAAPAAGPASAAEGETPTGPAGSPTAPPAGPDGSGDAPRRRRRRRRGRRGGAQQPFAAVAGDAAAGEGTSETDDLLDTDGDTDGDEPGDDEHAMTTAAASPWPFSGTPWTPPWSTSSSPASEPAVAAEPAAITAAAPVAAPEPHAEQPMPPRDEAVSPAEAPEPGPPDQGPADR